MSSGRPKLDGEGWPIRVGACHIAEHHMTLAEVLTAVASAGALPEWAPKSMADLDRLNAEIATRNAGRGKQDALEMLRANGDSAAARIRALTDEQLDRKVLFPAFGRDLSAQDIAQAVMIGHIGMHAPNIQHAAASRA